MKVITDWREFPPEKKGGVLCVGNFDGLHKGHQAMLQRGRSEAAARGIPFTVMTFDPHPATLLRPNITRRPLTTLFQREELLNTMGVDFLIIVPTTAEFLSITAENFLADIVRDAIGATLMVEGASFTFGRGAKGNVSMLEQQGKNFGLDLLIVPTEEVTLTDLTRVRVSSSLIRWLIENGRVADAARCLGRDYTLRGEVVHGQERGRTIGFPTANLQTPQLLPASSPSVAGGVFAGWVLVDGLQYRAAISIGTNPTFNTIHTTVEAYLLDFSADLYGRTIDVGFTRWIRQMETFSGVEPLIREIQHDVMKVRTSIALHSTPENKSA